MRMLDSKEKRNHGSNEKDYEFNRSDLIPSEGMVQSIGGGDFLQIGNDFLRFFVEHCDLKPFEKVLDVGCGVGRMAVPLIGYLGKRGSYDGFDIVPGSIAWCNKKISSRFPNFHFQLADIYNKHYNPNGKCLPSKYTFPYPNDYFDFVFLTSVFTHMLPLDMERFLSEILRVLKINGRCLITYFLLNKESICGIESKASSLDFKYNFDHFRSTNRETPELAIAYDEAFVLGLYKKYGLEITEIVRVGWWCDNSNYCQDIIIARK